MPYFASSDSRQQLPLDRQPAALTEVELRKMVCALTKALGDHWAQGINTAVVLGLLLEEKRRRTEGNAARPWSELAAWLETCANEAKENEADEDGNVWKYLPNADDCRELVTRIAHIWDERLTHPLSRHCKITRTARAPAMAQSQTPSYLLRPAKQQKGF